MVELGFNYRLSDILCALGISQLRQLPRWIARRQELAGIYDDALRNIDGIDPLARAGGVSHGYHLYSVRTGAANRDALLRHLRASGIGANVHYRPIAAHSFYHRSFAAPLTPVAEGLWSRLLTLPLHPAMSDDDVHRVVSALKGAPAPVLS